MGDWIENFKWDSTVQEKGYGAFRKWANEKGVEGNVGPIDLFLIQKDHESNEWWREIVSNYVKALEDQISALQSRVDAMERDKKIG